MLLGVETSQAASTPTLSIVAGSGQQGAPIPGGATISPLDPGYPASGVAVDSAGDLYIADAANNTVERVTAAVGNTFLSAPVQGMVTSDGGHGYWLVGSDGRVYPFGDA